MLELYSQGQSIVHRMNVRVKLVVILAFILFVGLSPFKAWSAYILFFALSLSGVILSRMDSRKVLGRSLLALPLVLPAFPLLFTGPAPFTSLVLFEQFTVQISLEGFLRFVSISLKTVISIQAAILLASTTRFDNLLAALSWMKLPKLLISIIGLMWRYLSVMIEEATRLIRARTSRCAAAAGIRHTGGSILWRAKVTGGMAGSLFLRSLERSDRIYAAMLLRGYTGDLPQADEDTLSAGERLFAAAGICLMALIWLFGFLTGG